MENENCYAAYGRTSKESDDGFSVTSQIEADLKYAHDSGLYVPREYVFREDFTGKVIDRPEYNKIRDLIRQRKIRGVIIYATDRLARRVSVGEILLEEMFEFGVELHNVSWGSFLKNTPEDRLRFNFETTFSSFERDKIVERNMRGKARKAASGKLIGAGTPPFGYNFNELKTNLVPNEYAPYVVMMCEEYGLNGVGPVEISSRLNAMGVPTAGTLKADYLEARLQKMLAEGINTPEQYEEKQAGVARTRGSGVWNINQLHTIWNRIDVYAGLFVFTFKGVEYQVEVPPIISPELASAVKEMLIVGKRRIQRKPTCNAMTANMLMARRLSCQLDDYTYTAKPTIPEKAGGANGYYVCTKGRFYKNQEFCVNKPVRNDILDQIVVNFVRDLLKHPDRMFVWWEEQHRKDEAENERIRADINAIDKRIEDATAKHHRILDRLTDELDKDDRAFYEQQKGQIKANIAEYRERRMELEHSLKKTSVDWTKVQSFAQMGQRYGDLLDTETSVEFWRGLVDDINLTGEIGMDEQGQQYLDLILLGELRSRTKVGKTGGRWGKPEASGETNLVGSESGRTGERAYPG